MIYIPNTHIEVDTVPFGCWIAGVTIMMFVLLRKTKRKMMVAEEFVLFFLLHMNSMLADIPLLWSEIDIQNKYWWENSWQCDFCSWSLDAFPLFPYFQITPSDEHKGIREMHQGMIKLKNLNTNVDTFFSVKRMCTWEGSTARIKIGKIAGKLHCLYWGLFSDNSVRGT